MSAGRSWRSATKSATASAARHTRSPDVLWVFSCSSTCWTSLRCVNSNPRHQPAPSDFNCMRSFTRGLLERTREPIVQNSKSITVLAAKKVQQEQWQPTEEGLALMGFSINLLLKAQRRVSQSYPRVQLCPPLRPAHHESIGQRSRSLLYSNKSNIHGVCWAVCFEIRSWFFFRICWTFRC